MNAPSRLRAKVGLGPDVAVAPVAILFGLNLVDEFDRISFAALTPEIRDAFGLTDGGIAAISVLTGLFLLLAAVPLGVLADRVPRVRLASIGAMLWATMSVLTGIVPTVLLLALVRLLAGLGRSINEVVHPSLLVDIYPPEELPAVNFLHRMANPLSALAAVVAGGIGAVLGWQWAFVLLAIPTIPLVLALRRIPEPAPVHDAGTGRPPHIPVRAAFRTLRGIRTLRRIWVAAFVFGTAAVPAAVFLALFFEHVYDFGAVARGGIQVVFGVGTMVGLVVGARMAGRPEGRDGGWRRVAGHAGRWLAVAAVGLLLTAASPWALGSTAALFVIGFGIGGFQPPYLSLVGRISPPALRAQVFGSTGLCLGLGGVASLSLFALQAAAGYRMMFAAAAAIAAVGGLIAASTRSLIEADLLAAESSPDPELDPAATSPSP